MKLLCALSLLFLWLTGCSAPKALTEQLILTFEPPAGTPAGMPEKGYPFRILVKDLDLGRLYDNASVVIRNSDYSVQFAKRGVWAVRPNVPASDLLETTVKGSLKAKAIRDRFADKSPDYVISGSLVSIEEDARSEPHGAQLSVQLSILRYADEQMIFEKLYTRSAAVSDTGYVGLARAFSLSLKDIYTAFVSDAVKALNTELEANDAKGNGKAQ